MRYIYMDEAGTSAPEPVSVVVGIIIKPDDQWVAVREEITRLIQTVPEQHRTDFHFHAKGIWGHPKYRHDWALRDRLHLITSMASIPARFGLTIALGKVRRDSSPPTSELYSLAQWHHVRAFVACVQKADAYLRERCAPGEIATLIAEDFPEMRERLRIAFDIARKLYVEPGLLELTGDGIFHQGISQIQDGIQFADKSQAPLLQVADACAFCLRRFFSGQSHADRLVQAMGLKLNLDEWVGPLSASLFTPDPKLRTSAYPSRFLGDG